MKNSDLAMKSYYKERAPVYDRVYQYPERQKDLRFLENYIAEQLQGLDVLEVAAGTGYWSQFINRTADSLLATDATLEALELINQRTLHRPIVTKLVDAYSLEQLSNSYTGFFSGLWLSHVPKEKLPGFIESVNRCLVPGARVLFIDNSKAQCERLPITFTDKRGNTFQDRTLDDGTVHRVLKNFPTEQELNELTDGVAINRKTIQLDNFWLYQYQLL